MGPAPTLAPGPAPIVGIPATTSSGGSYGSASSYSYGSNTLTAAHESESSAVVAQTAAADSNVAEVNTGEPVGYEVRQKQQTYTTMHQTLLSQATAVLGRL